MWNVVKILLLAVVLAVVVSLFRLFRALFGGTHNPPARPNRNSQHDSAVDLHQCPDCGAWIAGACDNCKAEK